MRTLSPSLLLVASVVGEGRGVAARYAVTPAAGEGCTVSHLLDVGGAAYVFTADPPVVGSTYEAYCPSVFLPAEPTWIGFLNSECELEVLAEEPDGTGISVAITGPFCFGAMWGGDPYGCAEQRLTVDVVTVEGNPVVLSDEMLADGVTSPDTELCLTALEW